MARVMLVSHGMTPQCRDGAHYVCRGMHGWHNCACSCHHGRTVAGTCATYGCDCHEQAGRHGLPFSRSHRVACLVWRLAPPAVLAGKPETHQ